MDEDIVVTGKRLPDGRDVAYYIDPKTARWYEITLEEDGNHIFRELREPPTGIDDDPDDASDTVTVDVSNPANLAEALKAAANVMAAIEKMKEAFAAADPNQAIWINGIQTTIGEQLAHLENTEFVITDEPYSYGGPGGADYNENGGLHRVEFYFEAFDGDNGDYASPAYPNMDGLLGIIAHELGHVSEEGNRFFVQNQFYHALQNDRDGSRITFPESNYWINNEAWAHAFSRDLTLALDIDTSGWRPSEGFDWTSARSIFEGSGGGGDENMSLPMGLDNEQAPDALPTSTDYLF